MYDIAEIMHVLTYVDKYKVIKLWSYENPIDVRIKFIRDVIMLRLNRCIDGWDIMEYNLIFQVICNRIINELNLIL
jgi:hypothetical protein